MNDKNVAEQKRQNVKLSDLCRRRANDGAGSNDVPAHDTKVGRHREREGCANPKGLTNERLFGLAFCVVPSRLSLVRGKSPSTVDGDAVLTSLMIESLQ